MEEAEDRVRAELLRELLRISPLVDHLRSRWLRERGLTQPRARLLMALDEDGSTNMSGLSRTLDVTPRAVTALVDGLEGSGLVRRTEHPTDRRTTIVELTTAGRRTCATIRADYRRLARELLGEGAERDLATSLRVLTRVRTTLEDHRATT